MIDLWRTHIAWRVARRAPMAAGLGGLPPENVAGVGRVLCVTGPW